MEKKKVFQLVNDNFLLGDNEVESKLYVCWDYRRLNYITTNLDGTNHQYFSATKHPESLDEEERYRVLIYCLGSFDKNEIVNYNDLFIQNEFIMTLEPSNTFKNYTLSEEWLNQ